MVHRGSTMQNGVMQTTALPSSRRLSAWIQRCLQTMQLRQPPRPRMRLVATQLAGNCSSHQQTALSAVLGTRVFTAESVC
eukprot:3189685-Amphidinium_carterae.2